MSSNGFTKSFLKCIFMIHTSFLLGLHIGKHIICQGFLCQQVQCKVAYE